MNDEQMIRFEELLDKAHAAALEAAVKAEAEATTWFPCGFAWVTIDGNEPLARHCRAATDEEDPSTSRSHYGAKGYPKGWTWWCPGLNTTQRMETFEAAARAFAAVLEEAGIPTSAGSRMD